MSSPVFPFALSTPSSVLIVLISCKISFRFCISLSSFESKESVSSWLSLMARLIFSGGLTMARREGVAPVAEVEDVVGVATFLRLFAAGLTPHCGRCWVDVGVEALAPAVPAVVRMLDRELISLAITDEELRLGACVCDVAVCLAPRAAPGAPRPAVLLALPPARNGGGLSGFDWVRFGVVDCASVATRGSGLFCFGGDEGSLTLPLGVLAAVVRSRGETDGMPGTFRLPTDSAPCPRDSLTSNSPDCTGAAKAPAACSPSSAAGPFDPNEAAEAMDTADRWDVVLNVRIWFSVRSPPMRKSSTPPCGMKWSVST